MVSELTSEVQQARQDLAGQRAKTMALQQVGAHSLCAVLQRLLLTKHLLPSVFCKCCLVKAKVSARIEVQKSHSGVSVNTGADLRCRLAVRFDSPDCYETA